MQRRTSTTITEQQINIDCIGKHYSISKNFIGKNVVFFGCILVMTIFVYVLTILFQLDSKNQPATFDPCQEYIDKTPNLNKYWESKINEANSCSIKEPDLWTNDIKNLNICHLRFRRCKDNTTNNYYILNNGMLSLKENNTNLSYCHYKCLTTKGDSEIVKTDTIKVKKSANITCDIFHIQCYSENNELLYEDIEIDVIPIDELPSESLRFLKSTYELPKTTKKYDFHLFVIDSLSKYHATRALQKTRKVLLDQNGVEMNYLNIIGDNSPPNAFGFLMNLQKNNVSDIFGEKPTLVNDFLNEDQCRMPLDNKTFIFDYIKQLGYPIFNGEDYFQGIFNHPNCTGFLGEIAHHTLRPIQLYNAIDKNIIPVIQRRFLRKCQFFGLHILEYFENYLKKYGNKTKSSLIWLTNILHDNMDTTFGLDDVLEEFLIKNSQALNNSFFILMGDHGHRSAYRNTISGTFEHKNPYFIIKLPFELQKNKELMENLQINSNKHISHYDVYATLLDIITEASKNNFTNLQPYNLSNVVNYKIKGLSLLRPLPHESRSCYDMLIPKTFCMCTPNYQLLPESFKYEYDKLKENFILEINKKLEDNNLKEKCAQLTLDETEKFFVKKAKNDRNITLYEVRATTSPGKANYMAYFNENFNLEDDNIMRLNRYAEQAEICASTETNRMYCFCKSLLNKDN